MPNHDEVIDRWAAQIDGPACHKSMRGARIFAEGMTIYSYGRHFPMATIYRKRPGCPAFVLVNGDRFSSTTTRHQSAVRGGLYNHAHLIVPFSALDGAGIDRDSIRPLEILPDTYAESKHLYSLTKMRHAASCQYSGIRETGREAGECSANAESFERNHARGNRTFTPDSGDWRPIDRGADEYYRVPVWRHFLGEALFTAQIRGGQRSKFLSAFDHDEPRWARDSNYFLAQLPASNVKTVADAFELLAPAIVKRAIARDIDVKRQGDLYAIPCELPPEITRPAPFKRNTAIYRYLPFRAPEFRMAPIMERRYPGFAWRNHVQVETGQAPQATTVRWPRYVFERVQRNQLLGTEHTATDVLIPATGETYARGILRHETGMRDKDHADIRLGAQWHLIVRNTVPRARVLR